MKTLNFRYYPPRLFVGLILLLLIIYISVKGFISKTPYQEIFKTDISIFAASGFIVLILAIIAKNLKFNWFYKILDLPFIEGKYKGELISSYFIDDDKSKGHEIRTYECEIKQTLNGFSVVGKITNNEILSSTFKSIWTDIIRNEDGSYQLIFTYQNQPERFSTQKEKYQLEIHHGLCQLEVSENQNKLKGHYFNNERESYGKIEIRKK